MDKSSSSFILGLFMLLTGIQLAIISNQIGCNAIVAYLIVFVGFIVTLKPAIAYVFGKDNKDN